jgi:hypothetical protein
MDDDEEAIESRDPAVLFVNDDKEELPAILGRVNALIDTFLHERKSVSLTTATTTAARPQPQPQPLSFDKTSDAELASMLNRQDASVQLAVAVELASRCATASPKREKTLEQLSTATAVRALIDLFFSENAQVHLLALKILFAAADRDESLLRRVGAIRSLVETLAIVGDAGKAITLVIFQRIAAD